MRTWLHDFYKECGREATLAYTTLNQMKNWAMVIAAAALSGLPFGSKSSEYPTPIMFAGSVIVYLIPSSCGFSSAQFFST